MTRAMPLVALTVATAIVLAGCASAPPSPLNPVVAPPDSVA